MYMLAPFPPNHLRDAKLLMVEERFAQANPTPAELLKAIPTAKPMDRGEVLEQRLGLAGCYSIAIHKMPPAELDWNQFFNIKPKALPPVAASSSTAAGIPTLL